MGIIQNFSLMFLANGIALYALNLSFQAVTLPSGLEEFVVTVAALTLINMFIKPLVKMALGPILLLTLGAGFILVNAVTIFLLDFLMTAVTIEGLTTLFISAVVVSASNIVISLVARFI